MRERRTPTLLSKLLRGRLPQFDFVSVQVEHMDEASIIGRLDRIEHLDSVGAQLLHKLGQSADPVVDHEGGTGGSEVLAALLHDRPLGDSPLGFENFPLKQSSVLVLGHSQVTAIPGFHRCRLPEPGFRPPSVGA